MHLPCLLRNGVHRGSRVGSFVLAFTLTGGIPSFAAVAGDPAPGAFDSPSAPPAYPDEVHVCNGCHLSTLRYLARYLGDYPAEQGQPLVVALQNADHTRKVHTLALISWRGEAWCRDEYFGVFPLGLRFAGLPAPDRLEERVESRYQRHAQNLIRKEGAPRRAEAPDDLSARERYAEVALATRIIPGPSSIFWLRSGSTEIPVAFFRPAACQVAVYDPLTGTSLAECSVRDDATVVSLVAARLGYPPGHVRREFLMPREALLAAAGPSK